ncbi:unnamed protein product, partial [Discosporangium mesarthrocarpum]
MKCARRGATPESGAGEKQGFYCVGASASSSRTRGTEAPQVVAISTGDRWGAGRTGISDTSSQDGDGLGISAAFRRAAANGAAVSELVVTIQGVCKGSIPSILRSVTASMATAATSTALDSTTAAVNSTSAKTSPVPSTEKASGESRGVDDSREERYREKAASTCEAERVERSIYDTSACEEETKHIGGGPIREEPKTNVAWVFTGLIELCILVRAFLSTTCPRPARPVDHPDLLQQWGRRSTSFLVLQLTLLHSLAFHDDPSQGGKEMSGTGEGTETAAGAGEAAGPLAGAGAPLHPEEMRTTWGTVGAQAKEEVVPRADRQVALVTPYSCGALAAAHIASAVFSSDRGTVPEGTGSTQGMGEGKRGKFKSEEGCSLFRQALLLDRLLIDNILPALPGFFSCLEAGEGMPLVPILLNWVEVISSCGVSPRFSPEAL